LNVFQFLFGPVPSRRLGLSLGIDLVPENTCSLNCIYCESGVTKKLITQREEFVSTHKVKKELELFLKQRKEQNLSFPHWFTFSGSSEPTLAKNLGEIIDFISSFNLSSKIAVLTNSTLLYMPEVRQNLLKAHRILPSFDAALPLSFKKINRPHPDLSLEKMIEGLIALKEEFLGEIFLEVFIIPEINTSLEELEAFKEFFLRVKPHKIQLNTLDRPGVQKNLLKAPESLLKAIVDYWNLPNVEIIAPYPNLLPQEITSFISLKEQILGVLKRRPCTFLDLSQISSNRATELHKVLDILWKEKKINMVSKERGVFYQIFDS